MKHSVPVSGKEAAPEVVQDLPRLMNRLQGDNEPFVLATVVRTISVTAAKAGAKAVIDRNGDIVGGWIGGGCARSAVIKAAKSAFEDGQTRLISLQPADLLAEIGVEAGEEREGIHFALNMCPSQGTMDIFIEPVLPRPTLVIYGVSPVAVALASQAPSIGFALTFCAPAEELSVFSGAGKRAEGFDSPVRSNGQIYSIISTQGRGDLAALKAALLTDARHIGFVGSRRKIAALKAKLRDEGVADQTLDRIEGPAGLDLGAIAPEEIALSILAELLMIRRSGHRQTNIHHI